MFLSTKLIHGTEDNIFVSYCFYYFDINNIEKIILVKIHKNNAF